MGAPTINISFIEKGATAIQRGERGIVALVLIDSAAGVHTVYNVAGVPTTLTEANQQFVKDALLGYQVAPKKVIVYVMESVDGYADMMTYMEKVRWDWMAIPTVETDEKASDIASWIKSLRTNDHKMVKAVLPNQTADSEGVVNVTGTTVRNGVTMTAEQLCPRVAGLIAGTPMTISCTYAPLHEMDSCNYLNKEAQDAAVDAGKFIFKWDGEKVKVVRGVNSFTTTTDSKGNSFKKIKIVEAMDMIYDDIRTTAEDSYIGKYANSYDNKCLLITAIHAYFAELARNGILNPNYNNLCEIDIDAQRNWLQSQGEPVDEMTDDEIKVADTGSYVFLKANIRILDAMEDITLDIYI